MQNQVAEKCADCGKFFEAGESIYFNNKREPVCKKCASVLREIDSPF